MLCVHLRPAVDNVDRIATPHLKMEFVEEEVAGDPRQVRISDTADIETVPGTGERRPSRDRIPTPFIKDERKNRRKTCQEKTCLDTS